MKTFLPALFVLLAIFGMNAQECATPTGLAVSNINLDNATFSWTSNGTETEWEILILEAGGPFPLPTMDGIPIGFNPITFTGLECPGTLDVYVRAICGSTYSDWSQRVTFTTGCSPTLGNPQDLYACPQGGIACFDLNMNDEHVLGSSDPWEVEITYHVSQADAQNGQNPILDTTSFCLEEATGSQTLYVAVNDSFAGTQNVYSFTINVSDISLSGLPLEPMVQCDADGIGTVSFDLTVAAEQLQTSGTLSYYLSLQDAIDEANAIAQPEAYSVNSGSPAQTIYVREDYGVGCDMTYTMEIKALGSCTNPEFCIGANSLCNALGIPFANTTGVDQAESGNDYGCMDSTYDPTWFYFSTSGAGNIGLLIEQSTDINFSEADLDIDFICYGPFSSPSEACGQLTADKIVDCSYSGNLSEIATIPNAQPGQYYLLMASNYDGIPGYIRISETNNSQGEIDCTGLRLHAFLDANANGVKEASEVGFSLGQFQHEKNGNGVVHNVTSPTGVHRIYDVNTANTYDLGYSVNPEYASFYSVTTSSYADAGAVSGQGLQEYPFPVTVVEAYADLSVSIIPSEEARPGFQYDNIVRFTNSGSQAVASGTVAFAHDAALSILNVNQAGIVNTTNGFTFSFTDLQPFESRDIIVTMQIPVIPTVNLGDLLVNSASISEVSAEISTQNNTAEVAQIIVGSYDPNDKMEARGPQILFSDFTPDDYLYYTIRFENTGTASAINVAVEDMLDAKLDPESLRMVGASHNYTLDRTGSQLKWKFDHILLSPSVPGTSTGHGYLIFKIKPDAGYAVGDVIENTANIYFDFNPAIVTNTFTSTFVSQLELAENQVGTLVFYPNPVHDFVQFSMRNGSEIESIAIHDISGKQILKTSDTRIDLSSAAPGLYFAEVMTTDKIKKTCKLIVK